MRIALISCAAARPLDEDLEPLARALRARGATVEVVDWDAGRDLRDFHAVVLRSPWDYAERRAAFLRWAALASAVTRLLNPLEVVRWNTDKHYLADLERAGVPVVPTTFVEPGARRWDLPAAEEVVVKPAVGAGSRDAARYGNHEQRAIDAHVTRLLDAGRAVLLQPYLRGVDTRGETALVHFGGIFSHAVGKGPLLRRGAGAVEGLFAEEDLSRRSAAPDEIEVARRALGAVPHAGPLPYARVDVVRDDADRAVLLELELVEPSVFHAHAPGSADRFAAAILAAARSS